MATSGHAGDRVAPAWLGVCVRFAASPCTDHVVVVDGRGTKQAELASCGCSPSDRMTWMPTSSLLAGVVDASGDLTWTYRWSRHDHRDAHESARRVADAVACGDTAR